MATLEEQLKQLVTETCQHPPRSLGRQKGLTTIIRLVNRSQKLWKESSAYYEDALQQTWLYFCRNLCEATTAKAAYDPERSSIFTWMNSYLKRRLQDMYIGEKIKPIPDPIPPEPSTLLDRILEWVEADSTKNLRRTHVRDRPDVNAQVLILKRLPPDEASWQSLAQEFDLPISTLSSFYRRRCLPILKQFCNLESSD